MFDNLCFSQAEVIKHLITTELLGPAILITDG